MLKNKNYTQIAKYVEIAKTKEQLAYAMAQINAQRDKISVMGRQLYRNKRLRELDEIEATIKAKMIQVGMTDMFVWAGIKVFVRNNEIIIGLE